MSNDQPENSELEPVEDGAVEVDVQPVVFPQDDEKSGPVDRAAKGPYDLSEVPAIRPYVDLGALKVLPREGLQLRLDVEEGSKRLVAVSLDYAQSTLQVQAFSAPKTSGVWLSILKQITTQLEAQGALLTELEGPFGAELIARIPGVDGSSVPTAIRFIGVDGPRWVLRGTITGAAINDPAQEKAVEELFRSLVVVRGDMPMPPRELLPLRLPPGAEPK